jgi:hypothetical protein
MTCAQRCQTRRPAVPAGAAAAVLCYAFAVAASIQAATTRTTSPSARAMRCVAQAGDSGDSPAASFQKHRTALSKPGVHEQDGWLFSAASQVLPPDAPPSLVDSTRRRLAVRALGQLSAVQYRDLVPENSASSEVRAILSEVARGCDASPWSASGVITLLEESDRGTVVVVRAVPSATLMASRLTADQVLSCLRGRARDRTLAVDEAMVLLELGPDEGPMREEAALILLKALDASFGRGVSLTVRRQWTLPEGRVCTECVGGWILPASKAVAARETPGAQVGALQASELHKLDRDGALQLLGRRMHDKGLRSHAVSVLKAGGWHRSAELIAGDTLSVDAPRLSGSGTLSSALRRALMESPAIVTLLMSTGSAPIAFDPAEGPEIAEVLDCLRLDPSDSDCGAMCTLIASMNRAPNAPAAKLLAGLLMRAGEPATARVLMRSLLQYSPGDTLAALYLLRADRLLGDRASSRDLAIRMLADLPLSQQWREEIESFLEWSRDSGK